MLGKEKSASSNLEYQRLINTVLALMQRVDHYLTKCQDKVCRDADITVGTQSIMTTIEAAESPVKAIDLAQWIGKSKYAVSLIVDRMVNDGLIVRMKEQPDRRSALLKVTPIGHDQLKWSAKPSWELDKRLFADFSEEELVTFINLLRKLEKKTIVELKGKEQPLGDWAVKRVVALWKRLGAYD